MRRWISIKSSQRYLEIKQQPILNVTKATLIQTDCLDGPDYGPKDFSSCITPYSLSWISSAELLESSTTIRER